MVIGDIDEMAVKSKFVGILLIIIGALPFLLKIDLIDDFFSNYDFLSYLVPGEIIYQLIIILLGFLLIWSIRPRVVHSR